MVFTLPDGFWAEFAGFIIDRLESNDLSGIGPHHVGFRSSLPSGLAPRMQRAVVRHADARTHSAMGHGTRPRRDKRGGARGRNFRKDPAIVLAVGDVRRVFRRSSQLAIRTGRPAGKQPKQRPRYGRKWSGSLPFRFQGTRRRNFSATQGSVRESRPSNSSIIIHRLCTPCLSKPSALRRSCPARGACKKCVP